VAVQARILKLLQAMVQHLTILTLAKPAKARVCFGDEMSNKEYPGFYRGTKDTSVKAGKAIYDAADDTGDSYQESISKVADAAKKSGKAIADAAKKTGKWLKGKKIKHFF
jgi:hypothetical protein